MLKDAPALPSLDFATVLLAPGTGGRTPSRPPDAGARHEVADVADREDRIRLAAGAT